MNSAQDSRVVDMGNNEQVTIGVVDNGDGTFTAMTYTRSRTFKTLRGARMWFRAAMPGVAL